jgi:transposase-like protein
VRVGKLCSQSLIGQIAFDLLESCECWNYSPGPELVQLIGELLGQRNYKQGASREFEARERAIHAFAQTPGIGIREVSREVGVNVTTVARWRKDPDFNESVKRATEHINTLKTRGRILAERKQTKERN